MTAAAAVACSATNRSELEDDGTGAGSGKGGNTSSAAGGNLNTGGSHGFNGQECGSSTYGNEVPGSLLIVLDRSGSMADSPGDTGPSKWSSTVAGLNSMMSAASPELEVGLLPFPAGKFDDGPLLTCLMAPTTPGCDAILADGGCSDVDTVAAVGIAPLGQNGPAISSWLGQHSANGNTPTLHALKNGYQIVKAHPAKGQRYLLLMTDGEPTTATPAMPPFPAMYAMCGDEAGIENEALAGATGSPAVLTFVIGSPGSEGAATFLSQLAVNGGTPKDPACTPAAGNCHYQIGSANFEQELKEVLEAIAGVISDCVFDLPEGEDIDPNLVNVTIETPSGPVEIFKDPSHQDGWDYTDPSQTKIQLYGPACELYKGQKGNSITIILGCESVLK